MRGEAAKLAHLSPAKLSSPSFRDEYLAMGNEIESLRLAWEEGLLAVNDGVTATQRFGRSSPSVANTAAGERGNTTGRGATGIGLGLLSTRLPASPPLSVASGDELQDEGKSSSALQAGEREIYEAMALPIRRISMPRDQRIAKMQEDRERQAKLRERREAGTSMIRELQTVINLRPSSTARRSTGNLPMNI